MLGSRTALKYPYALSLLVGGQAVHCSRGAQLRHQQVRSINHRSVSNFNPRHVKEENPPTVPAANIFSDSFHRLVGISILQLHIAELALYL